MSSIAPPDQFEAFYRSDEAAVLAIERLNGMQLGRGWLRVYMPEMGLRNWEDGFGDRSPVEGDEPIVKFVVYIWSIDRGWSACSYSLD